MVSLAGRDTQDINPYEWLKTTLERIPKTKLSDLETLLPGYRVLLGGGIWLFGFYVPFKADEMVM